MLCSGAVGVSYTACLVRPESRWIVTICFVICSMTAIQHLICRALSKYLCYAEHYQVIRFCVGADADDHDLDMRRLNDYSGVLLWKMTLLIATAGYTCSAQNASMLCNIVVLHSLHV